MSMTPPRFPGLLALERRRAELSRIDDFTIKTTRVHGFVLTEGAGEAAHEITFPVTFTERPSMSFGAELADNEFVEDLSFPTVSVVVISWTKTMIDRVGGGLDAPGWFAGANLAIVTSGKSDQRVWVHWQAEGKALRDPVNQVGDTDATL
jgi:hypothetical protein